MKRLGFFAAALLIAICAQGRVSTPEIVLRDDELIFNGSALRIGQGLEEWDRVLPGNRRCEGGQVVRACVWDSIGFRVTMQVENPVKIASVRIYLVLPNPDGYTVILPNQAFGGSVELDGFNVTSKTRFSDVQKGVRRDRNIRCGLRECVSPHGALGKDTSIYFGLSKHNEHGAITAIELGGDVL